MAALEIHPRGLTGQGGASTLEDGTDDHDAAAQENGELSAEVIGKQGPGLSVISWRPLHLTHVQPVLTRRGSRPSYQSGTARSRDQGRCLSGLRSKSSRTR